MNLIPHSPLGCPTIKAPEHSLLPASANVETFAGRPNDIKNGGR